MVDVFNLGVIQSDAQDLLKAGSTTISRLVDINSYKKMEFIDAVNMRPSDTIDVHYFLEDTFQEMEVFDITERADSGLSVAKTYEIVSHLKKYRTGVQIDDESKIRLDSAMQLMNQIKRAGKSFAQKRDYEIMKAFIDHSGVSVDAAQQWDDMPNANVSGDIGALIEQLFSKDICKVSEDEIQNMIIYYPLKLFPYIREPVKLFTPTAGSPLVTRTQVNTSDFEWTNSTYGVTWVGSQKLNYLGKAMVVIPSEETADHLTYTGGNVPEVETDRDKKQGVEYWINTRYFGTLVYPNSIYEQTENDRIMTINNVCDPVVPTI